MGSLDLVMPREMQDTPSNANDPSNKPAGTLLREMRERVGLSIEALSRETGIAELVLMKHEKSWSKYLPHDYIKTIAPALTKYNIPFHEILMLATITERLRLLRNWRGAPVRDLAKIIGVKTGSGYQHYEDPNRYRGEDLPLDIVGKLIPVLLNYGATREEVLTIVPLDQFSLIADKIATLLDARNTTIGHLKTALQKGESGIQVGLEAGQLVPVLSKEAIIQVSASIRASGDIKPTSEAASQWAEEGHIVGWKRVEQPSPYAVLMHVPTNDHGKHMHIGQIIEIDLADRKLVDGKHYVMTKRGDLTIGKYEAARHGLVAESGPARKTHRLVPIVESSFIIGRVVRAITEQKFD